MPASIKKPLKFLVIMWGVFLIQHFMEIPLYRYGIVPRTSVGLPGIIFAPFLHGSFAHLISNTVPFLILGTLLSLFYRKVSFRVFLLSWLGTGVLVWIFGRGITPAGDPVVHIGASGMIYGIAFFLFFIGFFRKEITSLVLSFITILFYGGAFFAGIIPVGENISYESHIIGGVIGFASAFIFRNFKREKRA